MKTFNLAWAIFAVIALPLGGCTKSNFYDGVRSTTCNDATLNAEVLALSDQDLLSAATGAAYRFDANNRALTTGTCSIDSYFTVYDGYRPDAYQARSQSDALAKLRAFLSACNCGI